MAARLDSGVVGANDGASGVTIPWQHGLIVVWSVLMTALVALPYHTMYE